MADHRNDEREFWGAPELPQFGRENVPGLIERDRRLRDGEFDVVPGVRIVRRVLMWATIAIITAALVVVVAGLLFS